MLNKLQHTSLSRTTYVLQCRRLSNNLQHMSEVILLVLTNPINYSLAHILLYPHIGTCMYAHTHIYLPLNTSVGTCTHIYQYYTHCRSLHVRSYSLHTFTCGCVGVLLFVFCVCVCSCLCICECVCVCVCACVCVCTLYVLAYACASEIKTYFKRIC